MFCIRIRLIRIQPKISIRISDPALVKFIEIIIFGFLREENHFSSLFLFIYNETMLCNHTISKTFKSVLEFSNGAFSRFIKKFWQKIAITQ